MSVNSNDDFFLNVAMMFSFLSIPFHIDSTQRKEETHSSSASSNTIYIAFQHPVEKKKKKKAQTHTHADDFTQQSPARFAKTQKKVDYFTCALATEVSQSGPPACVPLIL